MSWASLGAGSRALLQFVVLAILARILTPADYGLMGAALIVVGISSLFSQMGVGPALVQMRDLSREHVSTAMTISVIFGVIAFGIVWLGAPLIEAAFRVENLSHALRNLAFVFPIVAVSVVAEASLQRHMDFKAICINDLSSYIVGQALVSIVLAYLGYGYMALVIGFLAQAVLRTIFMIYSAKTLLSFRFHIDSARTLFRFSLLYTVSQAANYLALNADNFIVARFFGPQGLGLYGRAYQIVVAPAVLVGDTLDKVFFPVISRVQDSREEMAQIFEKVTVLLSFGVLPVSGLLMVLAEPIVITLLGREWLGVVPPLQVLSLALFFRTTPKFYNAFIKAKGLVSQLARYQMLYAACIIGFALIGAQFGMTGVAIGVLGSLMIWWAFMTASALRIVGVRWGRYVFLQIEGAGLAAVVVGLAYAVSIGAKAVHFPALVEILISSILAGTCGIVALMFFPSLLEVRLFMKKKLSSVSGRFRRAQ